MSDQTALSAEQLQKVGALAQSIQAKLTSQGPYAIGRVQVRGNSILGFLNQVNSLREFYQESTATFKNATFLVYEQERLTFGQVAEQANSLAIALAGLGVTKGKRVALFMRNWPEWCIAFHAITMMGAVCVPLNGWWIEEEVAYGLENSGASVVICDTERHKKCHPCLAKLGISAVLIRNGPFVEAKGYKALHWDNLMKTKGLAPAVNIDPEDVAAIMYTSGTTGHPKGVVLTHRSIMAQMMVAKFGVEMTREVMKVLAPNAPPDPIQPCVICPVPLFHVTACHHLFLTSYCMGRKTVIMAKWDAGFK